MRRFWPVDASEGLAELSAPPYAPPVPKDDHIEFDGVVTDQVWLSDAVPVGPRSLTADLRVYGVQILVGLVFLTSQTPDGL